MFIYNYLKKIPVNLTTRLFLRLLPLLIITTVLPWLISHWFDLDWMIILGFSTTLVLILWWALHIALAPVRSLFRALSSGVNAYQDGEFNFGVYWKGNDELSELVLAHKELGNILREQRQHLLQRELLLDTMVQNTPVAMLLTTLSGDNIQRILFANIAARKMLHSGYKLEGQALSEIVEKLPNEFSNAINNGGDSLFTIYNTENPSHIPEDNEQTYHLARKQFRLNGRLHELLLIRTLTNELRRQEVQIWKKVIRIISHELNNSLAPIASLAHSGSELVRRERYERLTEVFSTIEDRARHLEEFIRGYARFAKLPQPQLQTIIWKEFLTALQQHIPFILLPMSEKITGKIDPIQLEQALLNLIKNAHEASEENTIDQVQIDFSVVNQWQRIDILDRGQGMNEAVLQNALVPFYSTKRNGTGLGLALTREIIEAHGGRLSLHNRDSGGLCVSLLLPR